MAAVTEQDVKDYITARKVKILNVGGTLNIRTEELERLDKYIFDEGSRIYLSTEVKDFDTSVANGTIEATAIAAISSTVEVTAEQGDVDDATIAWTIESYDGGTAGDYTATGVVTLPAGWIGTVDDLTATVTVQEA